MSNVRQKQIRKRNDMVEQLIPLISSTPFGELTIKGMCDYLNISIGTFYHYFKNKADLLCAILCLSDDFLESEVFPTLTDRDEYKNLHHMAHAWAEYVFRLGLERSVMMSSVPVTDVDLYGDERSSNEKVFSMISAGQEKGQITKTYTAEELTRMYFIFLRGIFSDWSRRNGAYDLMERVDFCFDFLARAFRAD